MSKSELVESKSTRLCDACASTVCAECGVTLTSEDLEYCQLDQKSKTEFDPEREAVIQELEQLAAECQEAAIEQERVNKLGKLIEKGFFLTPSVT